MGRQVNFYWHGDDEAEFISAMRAGGGVLLPYYSLTSQPSPVSALPDRNEPGWFHLVLWHPARCQPPAMTYIEKLKRFVVDTARSEVVELSRSFERDGVLERGRIWAELNLWPSSSTEPVGKKSRTFVSWYRSMEQWIRTHYQRSPGGNYIGPGAALFLEKGGFLRSN
jgi:hypothetical protein